ncbi:hypothetical protein Nepgr_008310 [Nepenthes gracilis]|uniref:Pentatricopeptide repeat-containing protein n=1 Tax=Nepenthes gracilis TaxID=150966 RepID=A0AAD3S8H9_NEPGR|nr:hypothetical protein Nepgr_008310 [Nepenthes gracilis]
MFPPDATKGLFTKYRLFGVWKSSIRNVHSIHRNKNKRPFRPVNWNTKGNAKSTEKENADAKVYMRDSIGKISNILRFSSWDSAKEDLERLLVKWDSFTINQILKTHPPLEKAWLFFNWASRLEGFKHDQFTYTTMLDIFGEARRISSMMYVFQQMKEKGIKIDAVTYTSLLHWLSNDGDIDGAIKMWDEMKAKGCRPTVVSYTAYMKVLFDQKRVKEAIKVYEEMLQPGCSPNCYTYTILMEHLVNSGKCEDAIEIFNKMQESGVQPDKATCNILVEKCSRTGATWSIIQILHYMKENSLVLRYPVYLRAHECLKKAGKSDLLLRQVNPHISIKGTSANEIELVEVAHDANFTTDKGLLLIFLRKKNFVGIDHLLAGMVNETLKIDPEIISSVIKENCAHGRGDSALLAFEYAMKMDIHIEEEAFLALIGFSIRTNEFPKVVNVVEEMAKAGFFLETDSASLLIYRLGCSKQLACSEKIFKLLPDELKNAATYTAFIAACFSAGNPDKGIKTCETMRRKGVRAAAGTYYLLIGGLEKFGRVDEAKFYMTEKRGLQRQNHSSENVLMGERICNLLFAGNMIL